MNNLIKKAKKKYKESIRGRDYQDELLKDSDYLTHKDIEHLEFRRAIFQTEIALLEDIFGKHLEEKE